MENSAKALYVHVPFCQHICAYCDFMRVGYHPLLAEKYLFALKKQMEEHSTTTFTTIYVGGGTPTALSDDEFNDLLSMLAPLLEEGGEFTIEANPENLSESKLLIAHRAGVNRVSLGVQTTHPHLLNIITRKHRADQVANVLEMCKKQGINNLSLDAMYGLPKQTLEDFTSTLEWFISQNIPHISLYALTIEPNSAFGRQHIEAVDNELEGQFYQKAIDVLTQNGYTHYEISNFCKDDKMSRHNLAYWHYDDFVAVGPGASGKKKHQRYTNTRNIETYFQNPHAKDELVELTLADEMFECVMMGLRLKEGISMQRFIANYQHAPLDVFHNSILKYQQQGWLDVSHDTLSLNETGRQFLHDVLVDMMEECYARFDH